MATTDESLDDMSGMGDAPHVFISHHSSQYAAAKRIRAALAAAGIGGWLAPDDIRPGSAFDTQILSAMDRSAAVVLLLCAESDRSRHVKREVMLADDAGKPVFPVRLEPIEAEGLAYWLKDHQWIDWFGGKRDGLDRLVEAVRAALDGRAGDAPARMPPAPGRFSPRRRLLITGAAAAIVLGAGGAWLYASLAAQPALFVKPGLWLNKREMVAVTFPQVTAEAAQQIKETVENDPNPEECISEAVARAPDVRLFDPGNKGKCALTGFQIGSGRLSGYLTCPMEGVKNAVISMVFRGTYTAESIALDTDVTMAQPAGTLKFKARDTSHWLADTCPAENR